MQQTRIYLDTSFISYLEQDDSPERKYDTNELWNMFRYQKNVELYVSNVTMEEISKCKEPKFSLLISRMSENNLRILYENEQDIKLMRIYLENKVLSEKSLDDLRHISIAVNNKSDFILSWNFKHFVNHKTIKAVNEINELYDLPKVHILPPSMLLGGF